MDRDQALAIQRTALAEWIASLGESSPGASVDEREGVSVAIVPACPERSIPNSVSSRDGGALLAMHDELAGRYAEAGVEAWTVWVPEFDTETIAGLKDAGHHFDGEPMAMTLELDGWREPELGDLEWDTDLDPAEYGRLNDAAYGIDADSGYARALSLRAERTRLYRALVEGETACVLGTIDHGTDLGFYFVATDPAHRGRGLASRLMAAALVDGRERGLETSSLQASAMGEPVYRRLGYEPHFRLRLYERRTG